MKRNKKNIRYTVYTDGGCASNPGGPGGCAAVVIDKDTGNEIEISAGFFGTTNNRMEMMAVINALDFLRDAKESIELYSDSQYVINTLTGTFSVRKNKDLWEKLFASAKGKDISYFWVRGHAGNKYNERCDELCSAAMLHPTAEDSGYKESKSRGQEFYSQIEKSHPEPDYASDNFSLPDGFKDRKIEHMSRKAYCEKYHVHNECAKCITEFGMEARHSFKSYVRLKSGGIDFWSKKKKEDIFAVMGNPGRAEKIWDIISSNFESEKDRMTCLRWYMRGLPLCDCMRKVAADKEVAQNCC